MFDQNDPQSTNPGGDNPFPAPADVPAPSAFGDNNGPVGDPPFVAPTHDDSTPPPPPQDDASPAVSDDLLNIKQEALQQLSPLVGHLDQSPEEKFRTTMMMIQASDDQSLLKSAYETAKQITDEKVRAQALLDVVNEINYFTQHHNS